MFLSTLPDLSNFYTLSVSMKTYMEKPSLLLIVTSLLAGALVTVLFMAQMNWVQISDCQHPRSSANTQGCAVMEYGYPQRFARPNVNVGEQDVAFATIDIDTSALIINWLIWSGASFAIFYALTFEAVWPSELKPNKKRKK